MPELPEVERAARLFHERGNGKIISKIETTEDTIVYQGTTHTEFADEIQGRKITSVKRYGKVFYVELDGKGRMPVLHFGMTGNIIIKGEVPLYYKEGPKKGETQWPPRFMKFILHLSNPTESSTQNQTEAHREETQIAFVDARRLGRIRLCQDPLKEPPISSLGFDPILSMLTLEEFSEKVLKRSCPVKALLLDQSFSAGVGNWVADEILYHSRIHPEQRCNTLISEQVTSLHRNTAYVCETAVSVNANSNKFPDNWLFKHRWGKGKRKATSSLKLLSGQPATIKWLTVGGRTSAYVVELQKICSDTTVNGSARTRAKKQKSEDQEQDEDSDLTALSELEAEYDRIHDTAAEPTGEVKDEKQTKVRKISKRPRKSTKPQEQQQQQQQQQDQQQQRSKRRRKD